MGILRQDNNEETFQYTIMMDEVIKDVPETGFQSLSLTFSDWPPPPGPGLFGGCRQVSWKKALLG